MYPLARDPVRWVLPEVLSWQAGQRGDSVFVRMTTRECLTFSEFERQSRQVASYFADRGVGPGDKVVVLLPNGLDFLRVWMGLGYLGAVAVVLNTELKGSFLAHQIVNSAAHAAVVSTEALGALIDIQTPLPLLDLVILAGGDGRCAPGTARWKIEAFDDWRSAQRYSGPGPTAGDLACIMYTSGTTGPAKGVLMPHAHCFLFGLGTIDNLLLTDSDHYYVTLPLFHANALFMQIAGCLIAGASATLRERFSASAWVDDLCASGATMTNLIGAMAAFIFACPEQPQERRHKLRLLLAGPNPPEHAEIWRRRYGVTSIGAYGMTEVNIPLWDSPSSSRVGSVGRVYDRYFEVSVRDSDTDCPLGAGEVGEVMVRPRAPFGFMSGYHGLPEKTCESWRNLWFHTGDAGIMDADGYLTFVDRIRDCIRRRGQNISSFEIESAIAQLSGVAEVAAFAVPSPTIGHEDEVMLAVVVVPGSSLSPEVLARSADEVLPRFAQPRYIEFMDGLPKTPTARIQKEALRKRGVGALTWDRERK